MAISLQKGQKISLQKTAPTGLGQILVNLNWNSRPVNQGFFATIFGSSRGSTQGIDLDLGCLYEMKNGKIGSLQPLGNFYGCMTEPPYMSLDGDDRTGNSAAGENLRINGNKISEIRRILVYTYIYEGVANWQQADATVTIKYPRAQDLVLKLDQYDSEKSTCALALFENQNDETFSVEKLVRFFGSRSEMDRAYNWGLKWVVGRK